MRCFLKVLYIFMNNLDFSPSKSTFLDIQNSLVSRIIKNFSKILVNKFYNKKRLLDGPGIFLEIDNLSLAKENTTNAIMYNDI